MGPSMGDSFTLERHACTVPGCRGFLLFFVDATSVQPGERARARCESCGRLHVLRPDGHTELAR
jgi:hypothetical protein